MRDTPSSTMTTGPFRLCGGLRALAVCMMASLVLAACAPSTPGAGRAPALASGEEVPSLMRLADDLRQRGELPTAIALYQRAASRSNHASELIPLGRALAEAGADQPAADAFRQALARDPGNPDALLGLGTAHLALGDVEKSLHYLGLLLAQGGDLDPRRYAALGAALDIAGRHRRALVVYAAGLDAVPGDLDLMSNLALSYALHDRPRDAIRLITAVSDALDARRSHHRNLVLVLALAGQERDAVTRGLRLLGEQETQQVLARAASVRRLPSGADRARAIGLS